jgi:hypothetical protein
VAKIQGIASNKPRSGQIGKELSALAKATAVGPISKMNY